MSSTGDFTPLTEVLALALEQATHGKGAQRHGNNKDFVKQPLFQILDMVGEGFALGQAIKKCQEAHRMEDYGVFERELLGAINYIAAAIIWRKQNV